MACSKPCLSWIVSLLAFVATFAGVLAVCTWEEEGRDECAHRKQYLLGISKTMEVCKRQCEADLWCNGVELKDMRCFGFTIRSEPRLSHDTGRFTMKTCTTEVEGTAIPERKCSIRNKGFLTMFNLETNLVMLPCRYRLADFTCGDYRVKVTPANILDTMNVIAPISVWVKVINTVTKETVELTTSQASLEKVVRPTDKVWEIKEGNTDFLDFAGYERYIARVEKDGVFSVQFSFRKFVQVSCSAPEFSSRGVPETLCGDGSTFDEMEKASSELTAFYFLHYIILNDTTVTQSENCAAMASSFQGCENKELVIHLCLTYFSNWIRIFRLASLGTRHEDCLEYCVWTNCYGNDWNRPVPRC